MKRLVTFVVAACLVLAPSAAAKGWLPHPVYDELVSAGLGVAMEMAVKGLTDPTYDNTSVYIGDFHCKGGPKLWRCGILVHRSHGAGWCATHAIVSRHSEWVSAVMTCGIPTNPWHGGSTAAFSG